VVFAYDVLEGKVDTGNRVLIIGGGMVGAETASHLANHGRDVAIVEELSELALDEQPVVRGFLLKELKERNVKAYVNSAVRAILDAHVIIANGRRGRVNPSRHGRRRRGRAAREHPRPRTAKHPMADRHGWGRTRGEERPRSHRGRL